MFRTAILTLALGLSPTLFAQSMSHTLPAGWETMEGGSSTAFPQNDANNHIWQWHYDNSNFTQTGPIVITEVSIRADSSNAVAAFNFPSWQVTLIEASTDYQVANHNPVFAANILNSAIVKTGPFVGGPVPASGGPTATWIPMGLQSSFQYDPTQGNDFIVQIEKCSTTSTWAAALDGATGGVGVVGGNRYGDTANCMATSHSFNNNEFVPIVLITWQPAAGDDVALQRVDAPTTPVNSCDVLGNSESVVVTVRNTGSNQLNAGTFVTLGYSVDGGSTIVETVSFNNTLQFGQSETFTFSTPADFSTPGPHTINAVVSYSLDGNPNNDILAATLTNPTLFTAGAFPYTEDFDTIGAPSGSTTPPFEWGQDATDGMVDWVFLNAPTPNAGTGPLVDHTSGNGFFAYVDDASEEAAVNLVTPCFRLNSLANPTLTFWLHHFNGGTSGNTLSVDVLTTPGGVPVLDVLGPLAPSANNQWELQVVNLAAWAGQDIQIRFRASTNNGAPSANDIAIDDVRVLDLVTGLGQAPQPGLAVFDMNGATDLNGFRVPLGFNGPFTSTVTVGDALHLDFAGATNQPILLLAGLTSPALLGLGAIGQIDVGTSVDPMTGLPLGVAVIGDGTQASLPNFFFRTQSSGMTRISFPMAPFPIGYVTTLQPLMFTGGSSVIAAGNAIELHAQ
ncbi:MAG: choice-of-anchor J domain-containing protein [Planctomycetes bacterium]|nr:choice-of-anchor J domain-containing protein [Planctomycetota bacterium]